MCNSTYWREIPEHEDDIFIDNIYWTISKPWYLCWNNWFNTKTNIILNSIGSKIFTEVFLHEECSECENKDKCLSEMEKEIPNIINDFIRENWLPNKSVIRDDNQI